VQWDVFQGVPADDLRAVLALARRRTFARGEVVFHRGDPADSLHLVTKGRFAVRIVTPLGEVALLSVRGPGDAFGELALLSETSRSATVSALEPAETLCVLRGDLRRLAGREPAVNAMLVRLLTDQVRWLSDRLSEAHYVDAERRLVRRLVELADVYGHEGSVVPLTQEDLAGIAGTSRATVNRTLRDLERRGLVRLGRGRTEVVDREGLARRGR
jgi:CRP/FNR family transcriptional regulator, cyclic AMP receptor protein